MLKNYLKIAWRNLWRSKGYSAINIVGLALGMSACFFIFQYVYFEASYDRFNTNLKNIYRVPISYSGSFADVPVTASNHPALGPAMKADFPEVVDFVRVVNTSLFLTGSSMSYKEAGQTPKTFNEANIYLADPSFFTIFSYPLVTGNRKTCLQEAGGIVISETSAKKYFGSQNPIGKNLNLNGRLPLKVTAVCKDVPENSHLKFDMILSFETVGHEWGYTEWGWPEFYNYIVLAPGTDIRKLEAKFPAFIEKYLGKKMKELNFRSYFHLQPVADIHLKSNYLKEAEANGSDKEVYFLAVIGVFILFIAWINYINLSTAKSMERAREVGLRKALGALKDQLIGQFLLESFILNTLALVLAAALVLVFRPHFREFIGKDINSGFFSVGLGGEPVFWLAVLALFCVGALLVGAYPAFVLSSFMPSKVLKGTFGKLGSGISLRRVLVSFQFVLSILLISATCIVVQQFNYMRHGNLGYQKEQVLVVKTPTIADSTLAGRYSFFKSEFKSLPSVRNVTFTSDVPGKMILSRNNLRRESQEKQFGFTTYLMDIDENYIPTYGINLVAGKNILATDSSQLTADGDAKVLINEEVVKGLGFKSAQEALDQVLIFALGQGEVRCRVAGVMKNIHHRSLKEKFFPVLCFYPSYVRWKYISVKLNAADPARSIAEVEKLYSKAFPGNPFEYFFLDEYFDQQYQADGRLGKVFGLFALLAVVVACMGLLGLSSFVIKLRTKEIGIRKVLGSPVSGLLFLLSRDFIKLVGIATFISLPVIYFLASSWLENYAFHIRLGWFVFIVPPLLLLIITLVTICLQSLKVALTNPVKTLRNE